MEIHQYILPYTCTTYGLPVIPSSIYKEGVTGTHRKSHYTKYTRNSITCTNTKNTCTKYTFYSHLSLSKVSLYLPHITTPPQTAIQTHSAEFAAGSAAAVVHPLGTVPTMDKKTKIQGTVNKNRSPSKSKTPLVPHSIFLTKVRLFFEENGPILCKKRHFCSK